MAFRGRARFDVFLRRWWTRAIPSAVPTFSADFTRANKVALVAHEDDWRVRLGLPEEKAELRGAMETSPVSHGEDQDAHIAAQSAQVL